jgi:hypothetical protein
MHKIAGECFSKKGDYNDSRGRAYMDQQLNFEHKVHDLLYSLGEAYNFKNRVQVPNTGASSSLKCNTSFDMRYHGTVIQST